MFLFACGASSASKNVGKMSCLYYLFLFFLEPRGAHSLKHTLFPGIAPPHPAAFARLLARSKPSSPLKHRPRRRVAALRAKPSQTNKRFPESLPRFSTKTRCKPPSRSRRTSRWTSCVAPTWPSVSACLRRRPSPSRSTLSEVRTRSTYPDDPPTRLPVFRYVSDSATPRLAAEDCGDSPRRARARSHARR